MHHPMVFGMRITQVVFLRLILYVFVCFAVFSTHVASSVNGIGLLTPALVISSYLINLCGPMLSPQIFKKCLNERTARQLTRNTSIASSFYNRDYKY